jgi:hypothetical protein
MWVALTYFRTEAVCLFNDFARYTAHCAPPQACASFHVTVFDACRGRAIPTRGRGSRCPPHYVRLVPTPVSLERLFHRHVHPESSTLRRAHTHTHMLSRLAGKQIFLTPKECLCPIWGRDVVSRRWSSGASPRVRS